MSSAQKYSMKIGLERETSFYFVHVSVFKRFPVYRQAGSLSHGMTFI